MHYHELPPPAVLSPWIRCFWFLRTDGPGGVQPVVPDGRLEIVIHRGEPFGEVGVDGVVRRQEGVLVSGQLTRPLLLDGSGAADVIGIRFRTAGAREVLGLPAAELTDRVVPLSDVSRPFVASLERAAGAADPVVAIGAVLLGRVSRRSWPEGEEAVVRLAQGAAVGDVARVLRLSRRTLERRVRDTTGLPPKTLQRVMRFRTLYALLQAGAAPARAAVVAGYYDQAHANRDFRAFAGASVSAHFGGPAELARALLSHPS